MQKMISAALLLGGLLLLYAGYEEYQAFRSEVDQYFGGTGSDRAILMIIVGAAAAIAGFTGLFRDRLEDSESDFRL